jgi:hypothetical protein
LHYLFITKSPIVKTPKYGKIEELTAEMEDQMSSTSSPSPFVSSPPSASSFLLSQMQMVASGIGTLGNATSSASSADMTAVMLPPADSIDESHLWSVHSTSEMVEMLYQMCFFAIGAPLNAIALRNFYKKWGNLKKKFKIKIIFSLFSGDPKLIPAKSA